MARPPDLDTKTRLLDGVVTYLAATGLAGFALRPLARALGCSTTALVHHLGSREEILDAAFRRAAEQQVEVREGWLANDPELSQAQLLRKWWEWMNASPANLALTRLGIEAAALEATTSGLESGVRADQIGQWRLSIERRLTAAGLDSATARIESTIAKAVFTGLVLDLIATGDRVRLTEALDSVLVRLEQTIPAAAAARVTN